MQQKKKLITALVTIVAATATAHLMQRDGAVALNAAPPPMNVAGAIPAPPLAPQPAPEEVAAVPAERPAGASVDTPVDVTPVAATDPVITAPAPEPDTPAAVLKPIAGFELPPGTLPTAAPEAAPGAAPEAAAPLDLALLSEDSNPPPPRRSRLAPEAAEVPEMPAEAATPEPLPQPGPTLQDRLSGTGAETPDAVEEPPAHNEFGLACAEILSAAARPAAMVKLTVTAPCRGNQSLTVTHGELRFDDRIDALGIYTVLLPALEDEAVYQVTFADGTVAETVVDVPQATRTERVVLQYAGPTGLQIHALEFGADYEGDGHVWSGNPRDADIALKTGGGFLTTLGDPARPEARYAEVYTLPADTRGRDGVVRLNVEAEVAETNCGRDIAGQTLQKQADGTVTPVAVTLAMPECDAVGEFLVLKNLLRDLKIAAN
jgi:hypothetical protein